MKSALPVNDDSIRVGRYLKEFLLLASFILVSLHMESLHMVKKMNRKTVFLVGIIFVSVAIIMYLITVNGVLPYIYYRVRIITIFDSEQGWSKERALIGEMAKISGPCADFAGDYTIRMINRASFTDSERYSVLSYKKALIGRDWESTRKKIKKATQEGKGFDYILGDLGRFKISFSVDEKGKIKDINIEEVATKGQASS